MLKTKNNYKKAFSLIELMIVVAIIGILAMVAVPAYSKYRQQAKNVVVINSLQEFAIAVSFFFVDNNKYPDASSALNPDLLTLPDTGYIPDKSVVLGGYAITAGLNNNPATYLVFGAHINSSTIFVYDSAGGGVLELGKNGAPVPVKYSNGLNLFRTGALKLGTKDTLRDWDSTENINKNIQDNM